MRLRRETGDFQIKIDSEGAVNTIRKGLGPEDFIGEVVDENGLFESVTFAVSSHGSVIFRTGGYQFTYDPTTGAVTAESTSNSNS